MKKRMWACLLAMALLISQNSRVVLAVESQDIGQKTNNLVEEPQSDIPEKKVAETAVPQVVGVTVTPDYVSNAGGTVSLAVTGVGLTADNWGVEVHTYLSGMDVSMDSKQKATVSEITASGAVIQIPANTMKNDMDYCITAGVIGEEGLIAQAQAVVTQEAKADTIKRTYTKVEMTDARTIIATLDGEVNAQPIDKTKIFIANQGNANENRRNLTEDDVVMVNGKVITIKLADAFAASRSSSLYIQEGAFQATQSGKTLAVKMEYESWIITSSPSAAEIVLSENVLDYRGGEITATLKGTRLDEAKSIVAKVFLAGETSAPTDIPVEVFFGAGIEEPTLTYTLPENNTSLGMSYILTVDVDGVTVVEGTVENPAKRAVVTVFPKGTEKTAPILSMSTITGNNKLEGVGDNKNITVVVSKQLGELKTVMTIYGSNMNPKLTKVRAIDENGVIWPVYDIPE